jgi:transposase
MEDMREARGREIAASAKLEQKGPFWVVPSQSGDGTYIVDYDSRWPKCSCPDHETRQVRCKHLFAVEYTLRREIRGTANDPTVTQTETLKITYAQNWPAYNSAQTYEKEYVAVPLRDLCAAIDNPIQKNGRPRHPIADMTFAAVMKVYATTSGRRVMVDMRDFAAKGYIDKAPHYSSIFRAFEDPMLTPILKAMIEESARPLRAVETDFAVDSSGFSTRVYERWFDAKYGRERSISQYVKAHIMVGVKTNIVTSVEVTPSYINDYPLLKPLLASTAARFNVAKLSADKGYTGRSNVVAIEEAGAVPLIPIRARMKRQGPGAWERAFDFFTEHRDEFLAQYHKRSNVETTFHMIKSKFGAFIRSKSPVAQVNEVLCKVLAHNLCVLVQSFFEFGIAAEFWNTARPVLALEGPPFWEQGLPKRTPWSGPRKSGRGGGPAVP